MGSGVQPTVAVRELVREYEVSGEAADVLYASRPVRVSGFVGTVRSGRSGRTIVRFQPEAGSSLTVFAVMADPDSSAGLLAGTEAVVTCQSLDRRFNLILRGCRLG